MASFCQSNKQNSIFIVPIVYDWWRHYSACSVKSSFRVICCLMLERRKKMICWNSRRLLTARGSSAQSRCDLLKIPTLAARGNGKCKITFRVVGGPAMVTFRHPLETHKVGMEYRLDQLTSCVSVSVMNGSAPPLYGWLRGVTLRFSQTFVAAGILLFIVEGPCFMPSGDNLRIVQAIHLWSYNL